MTRASTDSAETEVNAESIVKGTEETSEPKNPTEQQTTDSKPSGEDQTPRLKVSDLEIGDVLDGTVKNVVSYGVFVDVGCVLDVFVHVSDIAKGYIEKADDVVKRGMQVKVELVGVDDRLKGSFKDHNEFEIPERRKEEGTRSRTKRTDKGSSKAKKSYSLLEEFDGIVTKVTAEGATVKFDGDQMGFLPIREIPKAEKDAEKEIAATDLLKVKQEITIRVLGWDDDLKKTKVSMREVEEIEKERQALSEGFFVADEDDTGVIAAALRQAGIVREMFTNDGKFSKMLIHEVAVKSGEKQKEKAVVEEKMEPKEQPIAEAAIEETSPIEEKQPIEPPVEESTPIGKSVVEIDAEEPPVDEPVAEIAIEEPVVEETPIESPVEEAKAIEEPVVEKPPIEPPVEEESESITEETSSTQPQPVATIAEDTTPVVVIEKESPSIPEAEPSKAESDESSTSKQTITASMVKELRDISGAGMMDCKKALTESNGDMNEAMEYLKRKGIASAAKRAGKIAAEGRIASYIHTGSKLGILVEVNSETDFVARTDAFKTFVEDVAMTICANPDAVCVSPDDFPADLLEKEKEVEMNKEDLQNKPEDIREKIVNGRLDKIRKTGSVLGQPFIQDQTKTVEEAMTEVSASLGEKISIRRFERYELGEGLETKTSDFAAEVAEQIESKKAEAEIKVEPEPVEMVEEAKPTVAIPAALVKELRQMTGGGMMDCKKALTESNGDLDKAVELLRQKGLAGAAKKADRLASEGVICSYIHLGSKLGILAEVNCETDFVSRGSDFKLLADDIAMQIAAFPEVEYVSIEDVPKEVYEKELKSEMDVEDLQSKPEDIRKKIAEGRVQKTLTSMCLFDQPFLKESTKTVGDVVKEHIAKLGENIKVRRFVRYNLGEGIEKKESNFAEEVAQQTKSI